MSRKFIASVLAASLAVTTISAVPAKADNDALIGLLAGATALVIIGNALEDDNRDSRRHERRHDRRDDRWTDGRGGHGGHGDHRREDGWNDGRGGHGHHRWDDRRDSRRDDRRDGRYGHDTPPKVYFDRRHDPRATRDVDQRTGRNVLPGHCRSSFWTPDGNRSYMDTECLQNTFRFQRDLPRQCRITVLDHNRRKSGYSISCLTDNGYRIAGR